MNRSLDSAAAVILIIPIAVSRSAPFPAWLAKPSATVALELITVGTAVFWTRSPSAADLLYQVARGKRGKGISYRACFRRERY